MKLSGSQTAVAVVIATLVGAGWPALSSALPYVKRSRIRLALPGDPYAVTDSATIQPQRYLVIVPQFDDQNTMPHYVINMFHGYHRTHDAFETSATADGDAIIAALQSDTPPDGLVIAGNAVDPLANDATRDAIMHSVNSGGGLLVLGEGVMVHQTWPEFATLTGTGTRAVDTANAMIVRATDWDHFTNQCFDNPSMEIQLGRVITLDDQYSIDSSRSLLGILQEDPKSGSVQRTPLSWLRTAGEGRVFVSTLGLHEANFENTTLMNHWLRAAQWVSGKIPVSTLPSASTRAPMLLEECLHAMRTASASDDRAIFSAAAQLIYETRIAVDEDARAALFSTLTNALQSETVGPTAKAFLCRQIGDFKTLEAFHILEPFLFDPESEIRHAAASAVASIPRLPIPGADNRQPMITKGIINQHLVALAVDDETPKDRRLIILDVLGRRDAKDAAESVFNAFFDHTDTELRYAGYTMLGQVGQRMYLHGRDLGERYILSDDEADSAACGDALVAMYKPGNGQTAFSNSVTASVHRNTEILVRDAQRAARLAARVGGFRGSQLVVMMGKSDDPGVWAAMEEAFLNWPDILGHKGVMILVTTAKEMGQDRMTLLAIFVDMMRQSDNYPTIYRVTALDQSFDFSGLDEIDIQIFNAAAEIDDTKVFALCKRGLEERGNPDVHQAAIQAVVTLARRIGEEHSDESVEMLQYVMDVVEETDANRELLQEVEAVLRELRGGG